MSLPLDFHPSVQDEVDAAYRWYERRKAGLGRAFLDAIEQVLSKVVANPGRFGYADRDVREGPVARFPFAVYYRVLPDRLRVLAVYHTAQDPAGWQGRS